MTGERASGLEPSDQREQRQDRLPGSRPMDKFFTSVPKPLKARSDGRVDPGFEAALEALVSPIRERQGGSW
jgi:hypothetical protein